MCPTTFVEAAFPWHFGLKPFVLRHNYFFDRKIRWKWLRRQISTTKEADVDSAPVRCDCDSQPGKTDVDMPGHSGVSSYQLCVLPGKADLAGGMSMEVQKKVTKSLQTGA